jgi:hypothetical protein
MFASSPSHPHPSPGVANARPRFPSELVIGALVPPVLLGLFISRALAEAMTQAGLVSEQYYRGERLPTLNMPATATADE